MRISDWSSDVCSSDLRADVEAAQVGLTRWIGSLALQVTADMPDFNVLPVPTARLLGAPDRLGPLLATQAQVETAAAAIVLAQAGKRPHWRVAASSGQRSYRRAELVMLEVGHQLPLFPP